MKKTSFIMILCFCQMAFAKSSFAYRAHAQYDLADTVKKANETPEDKAIDEVVHSPNPPSKQKVKYVSQVTKYGFKDLFKNFSYNSTIPYSSQVNPYAETYMQDYLKAHGRYLEQMKTTALPYFNLIDGILTQYGLPKELKYLAVIESDLKSNALSIAGARGPWQFMSYTARTYGLQVNQMTDDRTDYYKSTNAAAKYLLNLYKDYKDWLLVIAAYNGGPGAVNAAIRKSGSRNFWKLQYYLPEESRNHVKKFIATHYVMETESDANNFVYTSLNGSNGNLKPSISKDEAANCDSMQVSGRYNATIIAKNLEMDISDFNRYNPGFDNVLATGGSYNLTLPAEKMNLFVANKYPILNECVNKLLSDVNVVTTPVNGNSSQEKTKK